MLSSHLKEVLYQLLGLSQPLADQVAAGHREEGGVVGLRRHRLRQVRLARARWAEQQDSFPWFSVPWM